eukprot:915899-Rhodomonas_salina.2
MEAMWMASRAPGMPLRVLHQHNANRTTPECNARSDPTELHRSVQCAIVPDLMLGGVLHRNWSVSAQFDLSKAHVALGRDRGRLLRAPRDEKAETQDLRNLQQSTRRFQHRASHVSKASKDIRLNRGNATGVARCRLGIRHRAEQSRARIERRVPAS